MKLTAKLILVLSFTLSIYSCQKEELLAPAGVPANQGNAQHMRLKKEGATTTTTTTVPTTSVNTAGSNKDEKLILDEGKKPSVVGGRDGEHDSEGVVGGRDGEHDSEGKVE